MDGSDFVNKDTSQMQKDNVLDMQASWWLSSARFNYKPSYKSCDPL